MNPKTLSAALGAGILVLATTALGAPAPVWPSNPPVVTQVVRFDPAKSQLAEGLAVRGKLAYVGFASTGQIVAVDLNTGATTPFASLPQPVAGKGFVTGLVVHDADLYAALVSFVPDVQAGVYKVGAAGGPATLFARDAEMAFPNGLAFDPKGQLYVTDSAAGAVFRISSSGVAIRWASGDLLKGGKDGCGVGKGVGVPFDIGANGIALVGTALYVTNTDQGTVVRIPVRADGSAGGPVVFAGPSCADLNGADGLVAAPDGSLVVAVNHQNELVRVDSAGHVSSVAVGAPLDFPASLAFSDGALYVGNFAFLDSLDPGLLKVK